VRLDPKNPSQAKARGGSQYLPVNARGQGEIAETRRDWTRLVRDACSSWFSEPVPAPGSWKDFPPVDALIVGGFVRAIFGYRFDLPPIDALMVGGFVRAIV
jgi:hypothetical protein